MRRWGALLLAASFLASAPADATDPILVCAHVPITGAAPIPHHASRFGQFYFDAVNAEQGGVHGRPVQMAAFDDQYYPAGAVAVAERCAQMGADLIVGFEGPDQMAAVARWAHDAGVPYLHGSSSRAIADRYEGDASLAPTHEELQEILAQVLTVNDRGLDPPRPATFGMVAINSPGYEAAVEGFRAALLARGRPPPTIVRVQKDENQFAAAYRELQRAGVNVVNMAVTPYIMVRMAAQRPLNYDPVLASASPFMGTNIVAQAVGTSRMIVVNDPAPAYDANEPDPRWAAEIAEFHRVFDTYSPEQDPDRDDYDWAAYLRARQIHHMLLALNGNVTPAGFFGLFGSFQETPVQAFPSCALDFAIDPTFGQRAAHVFLKDGARFIETGFCENDASTADVVKPRVACGVVYALEPASCVFDDAGSGVGSYTIVATPLVGPAVVVEGEGGCEPEVDRSVALDPGVYSIEARVSDCAGLPAAYEGSVLLV